MSWHLAAWPAGWQATERVDYALRRLARWGTHYKLSGIPGGAGPEDMRVFILAKKLVIARVNDLGIEAPTENQLLAIIATINPLEV